MVLNDIIEFLHATARSLGAEVTSPWFYLQFGLILATAGIAWAAGSLSTSSARSAAVREIGGKKVGPGQ